MTKTIKLFGREFIFEINKEDFNVIVKKIEPPKQSLEKMCELYSNDIPFVECDDKQTTKRANELKKRVEKIKQKQKKKQSKEQEKKLNENIKNFDKMEEMEERWEWLNTTPAELSSQKRITGYLANFKNSVTNFKHDKITDDDYNISICLNQLTFEYTLYFPAGQSEAETFDEVDIVSNYKKDMETIINEFNNSVIKSVEGQWITAKLNETIQTSFGILLEDLKQRNLICDKWRVIK